MTTRGEARNISCPRDRPALPIVRTAVRDSYLILGLARDGVEAHNVHYARHMKPPIYSSVQPNETPTQYMHRARQFRRAAMQLADYVNGEQFWYIHRSSPTRRLRSTCIARGSSAAPPRRWPTM